MTRHEIVRALGLAAMLAVAAGCAGRQAAPTSEYGYGDMFADQTTTTATGSTGAYELGGEAADSEVTVEAAPSAPRRSLRGDFRSRRAERQAMAQEEPAAEMAALPASPPPPPPEDAAGGGQAPNVPSPGQEPVAAGARERRAPMLIYEAGLTIATRTVREQVDEAVRITHELGGVIVSQDDAGVMVRVPAGRFREALGLFEALGDVVARRVTAQDVSEMVRDTRVRLQNAINLRDRLRELLRSAATVPESLAIERELERLNETIALLQGQLEALEERVAYSTITVRFQAVQDRAEVPREQFRLPFGWLHQLGLPSLLNL